jgi:glutamate racemase
MRIGIYDSGLGGIFILKHLIETCPENEYFYLGDQKNAPYGEKTNQELTEIIETNLRWFKTKGVEKVIIACNTICSLGFEHVDNYGITLVGIIEPTINQIDESIYKNILVLGTRLSIENHGYKKQMNKYDNVYELALPNLVSLIETNQSNLKIDEYLKDCFKDIDFDFDAIILGCTHYPIVQSNILKLLDKKVFNSNNLDFNINKSNSKSLDICTTADADIMKAQIKSILDYDCRPRSVFIK